MKTVADKLMSLWRKAVACTAALAMAIMLVPAVSLADTSGYDKGIFDEDGALDNFASEEFVAECEGTKYTLLQDAINAAEKRQATTVKLLANVKESVTVDNGRNVALYLDGHTLYAANNKDTGSAAITVSGNSVLHIYGDSASGNKKGRIAAGSASAVKGIAGSVYVEGGSYSGGDAFVFGKLNSSQKIDGEIKGAEINGKNTAVRVLGGGSGQVTPKLEDCDVTSEYGPAMLCQGESADITLSGGSCSPDVDSQPAVRIEMAGGTVTTEGEVDFTDTIEQTFQFANASSATKVQLNGGLFNPEVFTMNRTDKVVVGKGYRAHFIAATDEGDSEHFKIVKTDACFAIGDTFYDSLNTAMIEASFKGGKCTIEVMGDCYEQYPRVTVPSNANVELCLFGHTLDGRGELVNRGTLTINGEFKGVAGVVACGLSNRGGKLYINGGIYGTRNGKLHSIALDTGTIEFNAGDATELVVPFQSTSSAKGIKIVSGTFRFDPREECEAVYIDEGSVVTQDDSGLFHVKKLESKEVEIKDALGKSRVASGLQDAVDSVKTSETIVIHSDLAVDERLSINTNADFAIDLAGHTLTVGGIDFKGPLDEGAMLFTRIIDGTILLKDSDENKASVDIAMHTYLTTVALTLKYAEGSGRSSSDQYRSLVNVQGRSWLQSSSCNISGGDIAISNAGSTELRDCNIEGRYVGLYNLVLQGQGGSEQADASLNNCHVSVTEAVPKAEWNAAVLVTGGVLSINDSHIGEGSGRSMLNPHPQTGLGIISTYATKVEVSDTEFLAEKHSIVMSCASENLSAATELVARNVDLRYSGALVYGGSATFERLNFHDYAVYRDHASIMAYGTSGNSTALTFKDCSLDLATRAFEIVGGENAADSQVNIWMDQTTYDQVKDSLGNRVAAYGQTVMHHQPRKVANGNHRFCFRAKGFTPQLKDGRYVCDRCGAEIPGDKADVPVKNHKVGEILTLRAGLGFKAKFKVAKAAGKAGAGGAVVLAKAVGCKAHATVPPAVTIDGNRYKVTAIGAKAFAGCAKLKTLTLGKNIRALKAGAFAGSTGLKVLVIKSKKLTKKSVGNSLKGSNINKIYVSKKMLKKYRQIFKLKNSKRKVKVVA